MIKPLKFAITLLFLVVAAPAWTAMSQIRTFDLQHRTADELIPIMRPLIEGDGAISGAGQTLVIRASLQNLAELQATIESLDTARRQLMITVRQGSEERTVRRGGSLSGAVGDEDTAIEVGEGGPGTSVRIYSTKERSDERIAQRLRVSEGGWAQISAGEAIPIPQQTITTGPGGTTVQQSIEYRDVLTGFEVRPRITGEGQVALDVRPYRQRRSPQGGGLIEQQEVVTTVSGRFGEWIEIGGGVDTRLDNSRGIVYSTEQSDELTRRVFVRVDLFNDGGHR